jgi:polysaccharide export outer membrane protein
MALLSGCADSPNPPAGSHFQASLPPPSIEPVAQQEYRIGALDKLDINVFQVKDLTLEKVQVDAGGQILLPLIGVITAGGRTTSELSADIAAKLQAKYLQSPQVSVLVEESASQKVTVDGAVTEAGVFQLKGRTTLMQAVAMAKGPSHTANLRRVAVFRQVHGDRAAAVFDLKAIREGRAVDPEIFGNDVVVVDDSFGKNAWHEVISVLPSLAIFRLL